MKRPIILCALIVLSLTYTRGQESIISIGYGTKFVSKDSSAVTISIDLNRIPGIPEKTGSYFLNDVINSNWGYYFKPSFDLNIGNGVTTAPNNISVGTPFGLAYDFRAKKTEKDKYWGLLSLYIETSPMVVSDNKIENTLIYLILGPHIKYSYTVNNLVFDLQAGLTVSNGVRIEKSDNSNYFGKFSIPIFFKLKAWQAEDKKNEKKYYRLHFKNTLKNISVFNDSPNFEPKYYLYYSGNLEVYICPRIAINIAYKYGSDEPLFKKTHSLTAGFTIAK